MRIFLIGFMYCGKTTIGKKLSKLLGYEFIDTDSYIENKLNKSATEIFAQEGETFFREQESLCLQELSQRENVVISTGGGLPCFNSNMDKIKEIGKSIYLKLTPTQILSRAEKSKRPRPLLANKNSEEKLQYITSTLQEREKFYLQADVCISALSLTNFELEMTIEELKKE